MMTKRQFSVAMIALSAFFAATRASAYDLATHFYLTEARLTSTSQPAGLQSQLYSSPSVGGDLLQSFPLREDNKLIATLDIRVDLMSYNASGSIPFTPNSRTTNLTYQGYAGIASQLVPQFLAKISAGRRSLFLMTPEVQGNFLESAALNMGSLSFVYSFTPDLDHGWLFGLGTGLVFSGNSDSGIHIGGGHNFTGQIAFETAYRDRVFQFLFTGERLVLSADAGGYSSIFASFGAGVRFGGPRVALKKAVPEAKPEQPSEKPKPDFVCTPETQGDPRCAAPQDSPEKK